MKKQLTHAYALFLLTGTLMMVFLLIRIVFYLYNHSFFGMVSLPEAVNIMLCGFRMDLSSIIYVNALFILLYSLPFPFRYHHTYRKMLFILFIITNGIAVFINVADIFYYPFNTKHLTVEVFSLLSDFARLMPEFLTGYWYAVVLFSVLLFCMGLLYRWADAKNNPPAVFHYLKQTLIFLVIAALSFCGARGSLGRKPLLPIAASKAVGFTKAPLATNAVFTLMFSVNKPPLKELSYFHPDSLATIFPLEKKYERKTERLNVVMIILESFSAEFCGFLNSFPGYTPFMDSLARHSIVYPNMYADGERSIKGLSAVLAGLPNLMEEEIITSQYQTNCLPGIGYFLKQMGYHTSFFHGGINGTMNFDVFTRAAGFDHYFGKNEYGNDKDYDGAWGITDEEFFLFAARQINSFPEPFCTAIFSLSSHHPFFIPEKHRNRFPEGPEPIHKSIRYADYALRQFFNAAASAPWFSHTLFVITADHSFPTQSPANSFYASIAGQHRIPLLLFQQGIPPATDSVMVQQHDLLPSVLDYLGYPHQIKSFGNSIFSASGKRYAYFAIHSTCYVFDNRFLLVFQPETNTSCLYRYPEDPALKEDVSRQLPGIRQEMERYIKAALQTHNSVIIHNRLCP